MASISAGAVKRLRTFLEQNGGAALLGLLPKARVPKALPGVSLKEKRAEKKRKHREETGSIRAVVIERAGGHCEADARAGYFDQHDCVGGLELDHFYGGSGRRRQQQGRETCWVLCRRHHRMKTNNDPSLAHWDSIFAAHCRYHGYPPPRPRKAHVEHQAVPR